jgi:ribonuclease III
VTRREDSNERLEFLGDSVLGLSLTSALIEAFDPASYDEGALSRIRAQAVSATACDRVARDLGLPDRLRENAPEEAGNLESLLETPKFLASALEAVIGAVFLHHGFDATAAAVQQAFADEVERSRTSPLDAKSALQELLARSGRTVDYVTVAEDGPPHDRTFAVEARVNGDCLGRGTGKSKKEAEQAAAREALDEAEA